MAGIIGHMDPVDETREQRTTYIEHFEHYVLANEIWPAKKLPVLVMGPKTYGLLRSLVAPAKPGERDYNGVVNVLRAHFRSEATRHFGSTSGNCGTVRGSVKRTVRTL